MLGKQSTNSDAPPVPQTLFQSRVSRRNLKHPAGEVRNPQKMSKKSEGLRTQQENKILYHDEMGGGKRRGDSGPGGLRQEDGRQELEANLT